MTALMPSWLPAQACRSSSPFDLRILEVTMPSFPGTLSTGRAPVHSMGGGPRTYPGGVTKWQWKRMQLKKSRQIEKARLMREKHLYEARKRAEIIAATPVLEMPWQKMSRVRQPNFVTSDEQITKLAARFQKRGAEDLWTEKDGPEKFEVIDAKQPPLIRRDKYFNPFNDQKEPTQHIQPLPLTHQDDGESYWSKSKVPLLESQMMHDLMARPTEVYKESIDADSHYLREEKPMFKKQLPQQQSSKWSKFDRRFVSTHET